VVAAAAAAAPAAECAKLPHISKHHPHTTAQGGAGITVKRDGRTVPDVALPALRLGGPFDYVSLMVGINDLFLGGRSAATIWESGLKALYDEVLASGAHAIGMPPLPTLLVNETDAKDRERRALNELITSYARAHPERVHPLGYGVEWTKEQKAAWIEPDRLHLNEDGHKELGRQARVVWL
jgi:lysophospholipase L1-like esterase